MAFKELIHGMRHIIQDVWRIPVHCKCANSDGDSQGTRLGLVCIAMGAHTQEGKGMTHMQPAALKADWSLFHRPPPLSPQHSYKGYLSRIFSRAPANGKGWTHTWAAQIL